MKKLVLGFCLFCASLFGADISKLSDSALVEKFANASPSEFVDLKIAIHKKMENMKVKDARVLHAKLYEARAQKMENMSVKEHRAYKEALAQEMQKRLSKMSEQEARESGLIGGFYDHRAGECGKINFKRHNMHYGDCGLSYGCAIGENCGIANNQRAHKAHNKGFGNNSGIMRE